MEKVLTIAYGIAAYAMFLVTLLYAVGFIGNFIVPKSIDSGPQDALLPSLAIDAILLGIFAVQHSVMARKGFKTWWTRVVPRPIERSTYVLFASAALVLLFWAWRPLTGIVWNTTNPYAVFGLHAVFWAGWGVLLFATFLISHFELFGLRQVFAHAANRASAEPTFEVRSLYRYVRHPLYCGFLLAFWSTPTMTVGHLVFAIATTGYILVGIALEERDLVNLFGDRYRDYRRKVRMLIPLPR